MYLNSSILSHTVPNILSVDENVLPHNVYYE